jgi:tetratricopeptide (TPR) repeat protein
MIENDSQPKPKSAKAFNWILGLAVVLVACAITWVGWRCIDTIAKKDAPQVEQAKKSLETQTVTDQLDLAGVLKETERTPLAGSEILYSKAFEASDKGHYAEAEKDLTQVLIMIPKEAKTKKVWMAHGCVAKGSYYTMLTYQDRAYCYLQEGKYPLALADLNQAIKLDPTNGSNFENRARLHYKLDQKALGDADRKMAGILKQRDAHTTQAEQWGVKDFSEF